MSYYVDKEKWFKLPLAVRKRWWDETNYGRQAPSDELIQCMNEYFRKQE